MAKSYLYISEANLFFFIIIIWMNYVILFVIFGHLGKGGKSYADKADKARGGGLGKC